MLTGRGEGIDFSSSRAAGIERRREIRRHSEGAGHEVFAAFGLGNEGDGKIIGLVTEAGLVTDIFEGDAERDVFQPQFLDPQRSGVAAIASGDAWPAEYEVDNLLRGIQFEAIHFGGTHAQDVDGFLDGCVFEVDFRDDDAAEFFRDVGTARGGGGRGSNHRFLEIAFGQAERVGGGQVAAAQGLGEEGGFDVGCGRFEFPAVAEFGEDALAGGGQGLA